MKNITIGLAGANWNAAATAQYYAERGNGEDYAFGPTPAEALKNLESREATVSSEVDDSLTEEIAFLAVGAASFLKDNRGADLTSHGGYMGLIGKVIHHAPMLIKRWQRMNDDEFGGIWLYDVSERFGREWAEELVIGTGMSATELLDSIVDDEMEKWQ